jgi:hypothetical protein
MFAFANAADLPHHLALVPTLFPFQFNLVLLATAALGLGGLVWRDWRLFVLLVGSLTLHTFASITYRAPQTVEYLMPAYLPIAIAVGLLPSLLTLRFPHLPLSLLSHTPAFFSSIILGAGLLNGWAHGPSFAELADDGSTRQHVAPLLEQAPTDAHILADWRWATPLWYLQQVEGLRSDVDVRYVYNVPGEEYRDTWERRVQGIPPERPLLLTHYYEFPGYTTEPWGSGFLLRSRPVMELSVPLTWAQTTFGDRVRLVGYGFAENQFLPGQTAEITLAWLPTGALEPSPSFTLRLVDAEGFHVAQADQLLNSDVAPGEVRFARLTLPLYPTLLPGHYRLKLGAYVWTGAEFETLSTDRGEDTVELAGLEVASPSNPPFTLQRQAVPFDAGPTLVGVDYDRSMPGTLRIYLHWQGPSGEGIQIRLRASGGAEAATPLPSISAETFQTVAVELPNVGSERLWLSLVGEQGAAGSWGWPLSEVRLPTPPLDARFVPLGDEMAVTGVTAHPAPPGETMAVDVKLIALRPLTSDDGISVRLMDLQGQWLDRHDIQPALGAIPTLKWIRGSRVMDRHLLRVPEDFADSEVQVTLVAYERFRMTSLLSMDGRFSEVPLGTWELP